MQQSNWLSLQQRELRMRSSSYPCSGTPSSQSPWIHTCPSSQSPRIHTYIQQWCCCTDSPWVWVSRKRWEWLGCSHSCISQSCSHLGHGKTPDPPCSHRRPPPLLSRTSSPFLAVSSSQFPHQYTVHSNPMFSSLLKKNFKRDYLCSYYVILTKKEMWLSLGLMGRGSLIWSYSSIAGFSSRCIPMP